MSLTIRLGLSMSFVKPSQTGLTQNFSNVANMIEGRGWVESKSMQILQLSLFFQTHTP